MSNVAHSTLAGADLHDAKGVAAATSGQVYVANGAGTGVWQKLDNTSLAALGNPFANVLIVQDQQVTNTSSQVGLASGTDNVRTLNTVVTNSISGASLTSNQITLPAGTFIIDALIPSTCVGLPAGSGFNTQSHLFDVTAATKILFGTSIGQLDHTGSTGSNVGNIASIRGVFTLAGSHALSVRTRCNFNITGGVAANAGNVEVYTNVMIWRIA